MSSPFVRRARLVAAEAETARLRAEMATACEERDNWYQAAGAAIHAAQGFQRLYMQTQMTMMLTPHVTQHKEPGHEQPQPPTP